MSLKTDFKWNERDVSNVYVLSNPAPRGTILTLDSTDTSVVGPGDCSYGHVVAGSISVTGDRPQGVLQYDVTTTGPTFENVTVGQLDYSTAAGQPCALWEYPIGATFSTDQFVVVGSTGGITAGATSGNTGSGTQLGVLNGKLVIASAFTAGQPGSVPCFKLVGDAVVDGNQCIRVRAI